MRVKPLHFLLFFCSFFPAANAQVFPKFSFGTGFFSLDGSNSSGISNKLGSTSKWNFAGDLIWELSEFYFYIDTGFRSQSITLELPDTTYSVGNNGKTFFDGNLSAILNVSRFSFEAGGSYGQLPVLEMDTVKTMKLNQVNLPVAFLHASYKLIIFERNLFRLGGGVQFPFSSTTAAMGTKIQNGSGYLFDLNYEIRGTTHYQFTIFSKNLNAFANNGSQNSVEIGALLAISFPGRKDLTPPPDERD